VFHPFHKRLKRRPQFLLSEIAVRRRLNRSLHETIRAVSIIRRRRYDLGRADWRDSIARVM